MHARSSSVAHCLHHVIWVLGLYACGVVAKVEIPPSGRYKLQTIDMEKVPSVLHDTQIPRNNAIVQNRAIRNIDAAAIIRHNDNGALELHVTTKIDVARYGEVVQEHHVWCRSSESAVEILHG